MKPTPSKLVLVMSTAGLGFPLLAVAQTDFEAQASIRSIELTSAIAPRSIRFASADESGELTLSQVAMSDRPRHVFSRPDGLRPSTAIEPILSTSLERDAIALAMVLMADPPRYSPVTEHPALQVRVQERAEDVLSGLSAEERCSLAACVEIHPQAPDQPPELEDALSIANMRLAPPDLRAVQIDGETEASDTQWLSDDDPSASSWSTERVLRLLEEKIAARADTSLIAWEAVDAMAKLPDLVFATIAPREASFDLGLSARGDVFNGAERAADDLPSPAESDQIVVASHSDRVLIELAKLRSPHLTDLSATSGQIRYANTHSEKALLALEAFLKHKPIERLDARAHSAIAADARSHGRALHPTDQAGWHIDGPAASTKSRPADRVADMGVDTLVLSDNRLTEIRGGFEADNGLRISFGIERAVYLNGNLVTTTSLNVADLGKLSAGQAQAAALGAAGSLALIQSGSGNTFVPGAISPASVGTVIQNTLDNQKIQTITRIDAVVNSAGIMRALNLQSSMRSALIESLRK
jgi:hypothetical protein